MSGRTLFDKVWDAHVVEPERDDQPAILYVDLHLVHEVTSPQAFQALHDAGRAVRRPERTLATLDHAIPTTARAKDGSWPGITDAAAAQIQRLEQNCARHGIELWAPGSGGGGIAHVIAPELGATQPGMTIVCGDSHTSTHGAFGALAFGIGTTEVGHVLATQCLLQRRPKTLAVTFHGAMPPGVGAKDLALALIGQIGTDGGTGHVLEYRGEVVRALGMEARMTLCNMAIEAGARAGMVAPDQVTFRALEGLPRAPQGAAFARAVERWRALPGDPDARHDREVRVAVDALAPQVTYGTHPGMTMAVDRRVPAPRDASEAKALDYMALEPGSALQDRAVDVVFVGSCTNGRLSDLRAAAGVLHGRRVARGVRMVVVPGSERVAAAAEAEGLDRVFAMAGAEWRAPGCSMCIAMNGDRVEAGAYAVSTSNRNFAGRQGPGARTLLASPWTAAASAVAGHVADPRPLLAAGTEEPNHA